MIVFTPFSLDCLDTRDRDDARDGTGHLESRASCSLSVVTNPYKTEGEMAETADITIGRKDRNNLPCEP